MADTPQPPLPHDFLPPVPSLNVSSDDISDGAPLPMAHVYNGMGLDGSNLSPHLRWSDFPAATRSFAVTCLDPDAPTGSGFWHWVVFDIRRSVTELPTGAGSGDVDSLPDEAIHVRNDFGTPDYGGPAPPPGPPHRYVFAVHALDCESLGVPKNASPAFVGFNLTGHTLARGLLVATFQR